MYGTKKKGGDLVLDSLKYNRSALSKLWHHWVYLEMCILFIIQYWDIIESSFSVTNLQIMESHSLTHFLPGTITSVNFTKYLFYRR